MNTWIKLSAAAGLSFVLAACGNDKPADSTTQDTKVLRIATEGAYAPFNYTNADGSLGGFDVDVANALCAKMNVPCEVMAQDWDGIIPALKVGKYDAIVSAMSITRERSEQVDFSTPYFVNTLTFLAKADKDFDPTKTADIESNTIAAQRATISSQWLQASYPKAQVKLYDTLDNAFLDLGAGRADVMIGDKLPAITWLQTQTGKGFVTKGDEIDIDDQMAIAVDKGNDTLLAKINTALAELKADGSYEALVVKHFGAAMTSAIPQSSQVAQ
ncbi:MAG: transporter substrate-binding domain-containing protein [Moraxella sp.]|nr:transporter substrate-binding domain-containing protein [Moraxella sp.]